MAATVLVAGVVLAVWGVQAYLGKRARDRRRQSMRELAERLGWR